MVTVSGLGLPPLTITFEYSNEDMRFQKRESAPLSMECLQEANRPPASQQLNCLLIAE